MPPVPGRAPALGQLQWGAASPANFGERRARGRPTTTPNPTPPPSPPRARAAICSAWLLLACGPLWLPSASAAIFLESGVGQYCGEPLAGGQRTPCPPVSATTHPVRVYLQRHAHSCANLLKQSGAEPKGSNAVRDLYAPDAPNSDLGDAQAWDFRAQLLRHHRAGTLSLPLFDYAGSSLLSRAVETALLSLPPAAVRAAGPGKPLLHILPHINEVRKTSGPDDRDNQPPVLLHSARRFCQPPSRALNTAHRCKPRQLRWREPRGSPHKAVAAELLALDYSSLAPQHHAEDVLPDPPGFVAALAASYLPAALAARRQDPQGACCCSRDCAAPLALFFTGHKGEL
eukprot:SAG22_NODE_1215_length_5146_cov_1.556965_4_plen_344_part_00